MEPKNWQFRYQKTTNYLNFLDKLSSQTNGILVNSGGRETYKIESMVSILLVLCIKFNMCGTQIWCPHAKKGKPKVG